jgi:hypothetical protein
MNSSQVNPMNSSQVHTPQNSKLTPGKYRDPRHEDARPLRNLAYSESNLLDQPLDISPISPYQNLARDLNQQVMHTTGGTEADNEESLQDQDNEDGDYAQEPEARTASVNGLDARFLRQGMQHGNRFEELNARMQNIVTQDTNGELSDRSVRHSDNYLAALPRRLAGTLRESLKGLLVEFPNYRFIVHVYATQRHEDVKMGVQCFWDASEDLYFTYVYADDDVYCISTAFAIKF